MKTAITFNRDSITVKPVGGTPFPSNNSGSGPRVHKGFSMRQRSRIIRAALYVIEETPSPYFVTLTFPNMRASSELETVDSLNVVNAIEDAEAFRYFRCFLKRVKRAFPHAEYVWTAEVQPKRIVNRLERAVHFHLVLGGVDIEKYRMREYCRATWSEILDRHAVANVVPAERSAALYIAKYVSKYGEDHSEALYVNGNGYGMAQSVSRLLKPLANIICTEVAVEECSEAVAEFLQGRTVKYTEYFSKGGVTRRSFYFNPKDAKIFLRYWATESVLHYISSYYNEPDYENCLSC
jgi:hypothetical protein